MTEIAILKVGSALATSSALTTIALIVDPSITSIVTVSIGAIVTIVTVVFAFKTAELNKRITENDKRVAQHDVEIKEVIKTSDGMKDALVKATALASYAEGVIGGVAQAETKSAVVTMAKAEGIAQEKEAEKNRQITPPSN
jgi:hypothetical protein